MKKLFYLIAVAILPVASFSQEEKIEFEDQIARIDGEPYCQIEKDPGEKSSFYISDMSGKKLLYFHWNESHETAYFEGYRADNLNEMLFEHPNYVNYRQWLIRNLYKQGVLTKEGLNEEKLTEYAQKTGKEFTRKREENGY